MVFFNLKILFSKKLFPMVKEIDFQKMTFLKSFFESRFFHHKKKFFSKTEFFKFKKTILFLDS